MTRPDRLKLALFAGLVGVLAAATPAGATEAIVSPPGFETVRGRVLAWVAAQNVSERSVLEEAAALWSAPPEPQPDTHALFEQVLQTFALVNSDAAALAAACRPDQLSLLPPQSPLIGQSGGDPFFTANLQYLYARWLTHRRMYDEALEVWSTTDLEDLVDPAGALFFRGVCEHALLMKEDGLATLKRLLQNTTQVPVRYVRVAELLQYDLEELQEESLGEVARRMSDSERRLELGRGGQRVQKVQREIVATLDEIIKKLEAQSGGGGGAGGGGNQSNSPAQDSQVKGSTAPGEVDDKKITAGGRWGSLPPKDEARVKNIINQNFPPHYRQALEDYLKRIAEDAVPAN